MRAMLVLLAGAFPVAAAAQQMLHVMDSYTWTQLSFEKFEFSDLGDDNKLHWEFDLTSGGDLHRFEFSSRGQRADERSERHLEQALYRYALTPFWNLRAGVAHSEDFDASLDWAVLSATGIAPGFFEIEAELLFGEGGQQMLRVQTEYELFITQQLVLRPELEAVAHASDEPLRRVGAGLGELSLQLRLHFERRRNLSPYIGIEWERMLGATADYAAAAGERSRELHLQLGLRAWF